MAGKTKEPKVEPAPLLPKHEKETKALKEETPPTMVDQMRAWRARHHSSMELGSAEKPRKEGKEKSDG